MAFNKPIRRIAIVGTGVIGASWAAESLASGFDVIATDLSASAEANLRKYVDTTWTSLTALGLAKDASQERLSFTPDLKKALGDLKEGRACLEVSHVSSLLAGVWRLSGRQSPQERSGGSHPD